MVDQLIIATRPSRTPRGWTFAVGGVEWRVHGPYPLGTHAAAAREALLQAWRRRARSLGGWVSVLTPERWLVVLPEGCPRVGLEFSGDHRRPIPDTTACGARLHSRA